MNKLFPRPPHTDMPWIQAVIWIGLSSLPIFLFVLLDTYRMIRESLFAPLRRHQFLAVRAALVAGVAGIVSGFIFITPLFFLFRSANWVETSAGVYPGTKLVYIHAAGDFAANLLAYGLPILIQVALATWIGEFMFKRLCATVQRQAQLDEGSAKRVKNVLGNLELGAAFFGGIPLTIGLLLLVTS